MEMSERGGGGGRTTPTGAECRLELAARSQEQLIFQMLIIGREGIRPPRVWEHGVYPPGNCCGEFEEELVVAETSALTQDVVDLVVDGDSLFFHKPTSKTC